MPYVVLLSALARDGVTRDGQRDRVVAVAGLDEGIHLGDELDAHPERPAVLACVLSPDAAAGHDGPSPVVEAVRAAGATTLVLDRAAQNDDSIVAQAAELHEAGIRIRTLSLFYDQWLGKLPLSELERVSLLFDIGELHRARYGRIKRVIDAVLALAGAGRRWPWSRPSSWSATGSANRGPLFYRQARVGKGGKEFEILKFRTMRPGDALRRVDRRRRPPDHPLRRLAAPDPPRRAAPGAQHPPGRPLGRRPPARAAPATSRSWRARSPSTASATWCGPASPAGPR